MRKIRVGLIRHFKVDHSTPWGVWYSWFELMKWFERYDSTESLEYNLVDLKGVRWEKCYCSPMARAVNTAGYIYNGEIVKKSSLRELNILPCLPRKVSLPFFLWGLMIRVRSSLAGGEVAIFRCAIKSFVDEVFSAAESNVLIVSHWFVMRTIREELIRRGLKGSDLKSNEYGVLHVYESAD